MAAPDYVQVPPDSGGKKVDTVSLTTAAGAVERQVIVLADPTDPTGYATVMTSAPVGTEHGLVVRPVGTLTVAGSVSVSNFPSTQPVSGTFWQTTQPVSAAALPLPSGAAKDSTLTDGTQRVGGTVAVSLASAPTTPVTGTFWQTTQPVSGTVAVSNPTANPETGLAKDATLSSGAVRVGGTTAVSLASAPTTPVTGTFWQGTQPVSAASLPLPTGAALDSSLTTIHTDLTNLPDLTGTWGYKAGASGTPTLPTCRILAIAAHATAAASLSINGGDSVPIPAGTGFAIGDVFGQMATPTVVFTGTDSYFVSYLT